MYSAGLSGAQSGCSQFFRPRHASAVLLSCLFITFHCTCLVAYQAGPVSGRDAESQRTNTTPAPEEAPLLSSGRQGPEIAEMIGPLAREKAELILEIYDGDQRVALGTIISSDGLVATKASELTTNGTINCIDHNGRSLPFRFLGIVESSDLAILQLESFSGSSIDVAPTAPEPGRFVISATSPDVPPLLGTVCIETGPYTTRSPVDVDSVDLGMSSKTVGVRADIYRNHVPQPPTQTSANQEPYPNALLVTRVYPRSVAEESGILVSDVILKINESTFAESGELDEFVQDLIPGARIHIVVLRGDQVVSLNSRIPRHSRPIFHDRWGGGPFSRRRFGFPNVLTHDTPLPVDQCGGPLIDLEGNIVGINIARSLRVSSLALPIDYVRNVASYLQSHPEEQSQTQRFGSAPGGQ